LPSSSTSVPGRTHSGTRLDSDFGGAASDSRGRSTRAEQTMATRTLIGLEQIILLKSKIKIEFKIEKSQILITKNNVDTENNFQDHRKMQNAPWPATHFALLAALALTPVGCTDD